MYDALKISNEQLERIDLSALVNDDSIHAVGYELFHLTVNGAAPHATEQDVQDQWQALDPSDRNRFFLRAKMLILTAVYNDPRYSGKNATDPAGNDDRRRDHLKDLANGHSGEE
jgi:hypothetical protein